MPITELRIEGLRTIEKLRLTLDGLTVLIGDNGTGKSSILEACEILRRATGPRFLDEFYGIHGGLTGLLRQGAKRLTLGVTLEFGPADREAPIGTVIRRETERVEYDLSLVPDGRFAAIEEEIWVTDSHVSRTIPAKAHKRSRPKTARATRRDMVLRRRGSATEFPLDEEERHVDGKVTYISTQNQAELFNGPEGDEAAQIVAWYLKELHVHLPFEVTPAWAARALDRKSALRTTSLLTPAHHIDKLGLNLASSYLALKNNFGRPHWDRTVNYIRLGLGERVEDVVTWADPGGGNIGLSVKFDGMDRAIPSSQLSDGMLSYLAFIALFRLQATKPYLVAFDEPEAYLHPHLLMRVLDIFDAMARDYPVLLATHSDRLLDGLLDPAKSVVLCELDEHGATRLVRPDREVLAKWLERYRGLGDIRSAGHEASVLTKVEPT